MRVMGVLMVATETTEGWGWMWIIIFMPSLLAQHLSDLLKEDFNMTPNQRHQLSARNY